MNDKIEANVANKANIAKYFYMATLKHSTAVTDCIRARFTYSPLSENELIAKE